MNAKEAISRFSTTPADSLQHRVAASTPLLGVLPLLLDSPRRELAVEEEGALLGVIDQASLLESLGHLISARDDSSVLVVECPAADYSASIIAHAVEDADVHLVDLLSSPADNDRIRVTLRVRCADPSAVSRSLERHGYDVIESCASNSADSDIAAERLLSLQVLMNV